MPFGTKNGLYYGNYECSAAFLRWERCARRRRGGRYYYGAAREALTHGSTSEILLDYFFPIRFPDYSRLTLGMWDMMLLVRHELTKFVGISNVRRFLLCFQRFVVSFANMATGFSRGLCVYHAVSKWGEGDMPRMNRSNRPREDGP
jgi:hypothetical protein